MARKTGKGRKTCKTTTTYAHFFGLFLALCFFGMMTGIISLPKPGQFVFDNVNVLSSLCVFFGTAALLYFSKYRPKRSRALINAIYAASTRVTGYPRPETVFLEQLRIEMEEMREKRNREGVIQLLGGQESRQLKGEVIA